MKVDYGMFFATALLGFIVGIGTGPYVAVYLFYSFKDQIVVTTFLFYGVCVLNGLSCMFMMLVICYPLWVIWVNDKSKKEIKNDST